MKQIYYIGGSPCSGKSTVAEHIAESLGFKYFKVDDHLDRYMKMASKDEKPYAREVSEMSADEIWMRSPSVQNEEEFALYREFFPYIQKDLEEIESENIITEGASYLPEFAKQLHLDQNQYFCIVPSKTFQYEHYKERPWIWYVLEGCSNKEQAFENWMERDVLFGKQVYQEAIRLGYTAFMNDGTRSIEEMIQMVCKAFHIGNAD